MRDLGDNGIAHRIGDSLQVQVLVEFILCIVYHFASGENQNWFELDVK
jgi:hypothetical protein